MEYHIDDLPDELLEYILNLIPPYRCLKECMVVCKRWSLAVKRVMEHKQSYFHRSVAFGSLEWNTIISEPGPPTVISERFSHSACTYENSMYVFGGCTKTCTTFNDLWMLDLDTRKWDRPLARGNYPSPKACASMVYYNHTFILFGGWSHPSAYPPYQRRRLFDELHVYCLKTNRWSVIDTLDGPPPTSAHSASIHGNLMVIFGGISNDYNSSNDIWCLNVDHYYWYKPVVSDLKPPSRYGHSQIHLTDKHILIFGGCTGPSAVMNDVWLLTMEDPIWTWTRVNMLGANWAPTKIWCHQVCKVGNYVVVLSDNKESTKQGEVVPKEVNRSQLLPPPRRRQAVEEKIDKDENVNGRHGKLMGRRIHVRSASPNGSIYSGAQPLELKSFAPIAVPDIEEKRRQANRVRQLESLRRMQERIQNQRTQQRLVRKKSDKLGIFVLDITRILDQSSATWIFHSQNKCSGPEGRILYSLVLGKSELIVFGGIRKVITTIQGETDEDISEVYNDVHFIKPPRYIF
ncbi:F-box only protein 42 [Fopius arisanus]|uniref:F-box only protein 42 n=1 Tax=Fopius arisanus TaxID=64838 RepID=A0A9R1TJI3_9HYME|nr:PREDICTED: F-box only protein 42 [Fopius arisanus]